MHGISSVITRYREGAFSFKYVKFTLIICEFFFKKEFQSFELDLPYKIEDKLTQSDSIRNYLGFSGWDYK